VVDPLLPVIPEYTYGPQLPLAALVTHRAATPLADGTAEAALDAEDVLGRIGAVVWVLWLSAPQPVSTMKVADTAIAGQIRFAFTASSFTCWRTNLVP
jgi:hypothetical protein